MVHGDHWTLPRTNAPIRVALANKLVSRSDFPSQRILTTFARQGVKA